MKIHLLAFALLASGTAAFAQITIPSDGSDGAFAPSGTTYTVNLALAPTASYDTNNSANAGKGVYDSVRHAVVFKYSSVNIPANTTVVFTNHPTHAPVVWLVQGNVTIAGTVNLNGANVPGNNLLAEPGPGGFRGGPAGSNGKGPGLGIGGANTLGSFSVSQASYASVYGNPSIVPLIGGSGGGATGYGGGGGGGGAILIAAANTISLTGSINSNSGSGGAAGGSSGAIRLVANTISGTGTLNASTDGRIRLEANSVSGSIVPLPQTIAITPQNPPVIWPASDAPTVKIIQVDTSTTPASPTASLDISADVGISVNSTATVVVQTQNFVVSGGTVQVRSSGKFSANAAFTTATFQSGNDTQANWVATVPFASGFTTLQARATRP